MQRAANLRKGGPRYHIMARVQSQTARSQHRHSRQPDMTKKEIAESFLELASAGRVRAAFAWHVHSDFRHHHAYFEGDRESLLRGMEQNAKQFPNKTFQTLRAVEEGNLVVIHARVVLAPDSQWSVIHIFRFQGDLIIEEWEASQQAFQDSPNQNGIF